MCTGHVVIVMMDSQDETRLLSDFILPGVSWLHSTYFLGGRSAYIPLHTQLQSVMILPLCNDIDHSAQHSSRKKDCVIVDGSHDWVGEGKVTASCHYLYPSNANLGYVHDVFAEHMILLVLRVSALSQISMLG